MKLAVLTCAVFPSEEVARAKLWVFLRSCDKFGVTPAFYGIGRTFPSYRVMMLDWHLDALKDLPIEYTHVLFTDAWDAFFTAPLAEIVSKYEALGAPPILCSAYIGLGNESDMTKYGGCFDESIPYRYPNRGGYIAEIPAIIAAFERMLAQPDLTGDDCFSWYNGWREGWFRPQLDSTCQIFQVSTDNAIVSATENGDRLVNTVTKSQPCIYHLSGGYTDPVSGKDDRLIPRAKGLGIL